MSFGELPDVSVVTEMACGVLLLATVVILALIDCRKMILPDRLNALLACGGLFQAIALGRPGVGDALLGAVVGFLVLSAVGTSFQRLRGVDGLGLGDQKFSAAAGLWIGWQAIAPMLLIASCSALVYVMARLARGQRFNLTARIPFGPFLGFGTVVCWLFAVGQGS